ncbi:hypothetical protein BCR34DRAFT_470517, partial [Clohesyomyces aquaticus]
PKPLDETTIAKADEVAAQEEVPQMPVTLVTTEALASLHNLIKQDTLRPTKLSRCDSRKHTVLALEGKVRRLTRSLVLGKAMVISYEDLEEARANRDAKD